MAIGSVGYLRKPEGEFVTLFNAFDPPRTSGGVLGGMANLHGYGNVRKRSQRHDKQNRTQRGLNTLQSWYSSKLDSCVNPSPRPNVSHGGCRNNINRRYSCDVKAGHRTAFLFVESTMYEYIEELSAPKKWFVANVDEILRSYADGHSITKEDLFLGMRNRPQSAPKCSLLSRQLQRR